MPRPDDPPDDPPADARRHAPATLRNRAPILAVLREILPARGRVLEVGAGSGEHAAAFAAALPDIVWQPSDVEPESLASIAAWAAEAAAPNLRPPLRLDLLDAGWPDAAAAAAGGPYDALVCINVLHIAPWSVCEGLMAGVPRVLAAGQRARTSAPGGVLYLYGPYRIEGRHTAPSNAAFDESLRATDPSWGVRDVADVAAAAARAGLTLARQVPMPANNLSLVFRRAPAATT